MKRRIAVVDDDAENRRAVSELLTVEGFDPLAFESGDAAWAAIASQQVRPDAVVADVLMPGLDGVALLRRIKAGFPAMPVVLMSGFVDATVSSDGLRAGALKVLSKPIRGSGLVSVLLEAFGPDQA